MTCLVLVALPFLLPASALQSTGPSTHRAGQVECSHDREAALRNLRRGSASLWIFHTTHHAGTSLNAVIDANMEMSSVEHGSSGLQEAELELGRWYYDKLFGEGGLLPAPLQSQVPCESDKFVSVYPTRDPIARILSGDGRWTTNATHYTDSCNTDNYGLRKLIGKAFGEALTPQDVELAKRRLDSFDAVLDVSSMADSVNALCKAAEFKVCTHPWVSGKHHVLSREEILELVGPRVYETWMRRNAPELEMYAHAQQLAQNFINEYPRAHDGFPAPAREEGDSVQAADTDRWLCH